MIITERTWGDFEIVVNQIYEELINYNVKYIFGIPRGGIPLACRLSYLFNSELILNGKEIISYFDKLKDDEIILCVDDIVHSGETLLNNIPNNNKIIFCSWYINEIIPEEIKSKIFYYSEKSKRNEWVKFPWESLENYELKLKQHSHLENF